MAKSEAASFLSTGVGARRSSSRGAVVMSGRVEPALPQVLCLGASVATSCRCRGCGGEVALISKRHGGKRAEGGFMGFLGSVW
jgi:hypothetical protein